jgi:hypothetical protein
MLNPRSPSPIDFAASKHVTRNYFEETDNDCSTARKGHKSVVAEVTYPPKDRRQIRFCIIKRSVLWYSKDGPTVSSVTNRVSGGPVPCDERENAAQAYLAWPRRSSSFAACFAARLG